MERLTYRSKWGDYGANVEYADEWEEKCELRNRLGAYEDLGYSPEELKEIIDKIKEKNRRINNV